MSNSSILFQKQVRDNSTDLHSFVKELSSWEEEMKRKESSRSGDKDPQDLPPIRSKNIRKSSNSINSSSDTLKLNKIRATDYSSWDKFDVDAACQQLDDDKKTPPPLTPEQLEKEKQRAYVEKENGNKFVKSQKWIEAIKCYTKAIEAYDSDPVFYANRALCYLKLKEYVNAEIDCTNSLRLDGTYVKALQRRAAARIQLTQLNEALNDLTKVMQLEPNNRESLVEITKLKAKLNIIDEPKLKKAFTGSVTPQPVPIPTTSTETDLKQTETKVNLRTNQENILQAERARHEDGIERKSNENSLVPSINNHGNKRNIVAAVEKQNENLIWDNLNNRILIRPIVKPPHLRSKKPLKRIIVEEIDGDVDVNVNNVRTSSCNKEEIVKSSNNIVVASNKHVQEIKPVDKQGIDKAFIDDKTSSLNTESININININTLPTPKTCLQFSTIWKRLGNDSKLKYQYFTTKIKHEELTHLFKEFLESDLFFDIIHVLNDNYNNHYNNSLLIYNYLLSFTNVKRFTTILLFATHSQKLCVQNILDKLKQSSVVDSNDDQQQQEVTSPTAAPSSWACLIDQLQQIYGI